MHDLLEALNRAFAALPARVLAIRHIIWGVTVVLAVVMGIGASRVQIDMTMESYFFEDDPVRRLHDRFKATFGSDDSVYIVYRAKDGDVLSAASLEAVRSVERVLLRGDDRVPEEDADELDRILEVTTIANARYLEVRGDSLISRDFVEEIPESEAAREDLRAVALSHPDYPGFYISTDSEYGGIAIRTDLGLIADTSDGIDDAFGEDAFGESAFADEEAAGDASASVSQPVEMQEYAAFTSALNHVLARPEHSDALEFFPVGNPILLAFFDDVVMGELDGLLSGALLIMLTVLAFLFRSFSGVLWPLTLILLTAVYTLGVLGWLGVKLNSMVSVLMILILVVGIADAVHIMSGYLHWRRQGEAHRVALEHVYRTSGLACLLTSVTTAMGMLSLSLVPLPPIRFFGYSAALGVLFAFVFTVVLLPLMLDLWSPARRRDDRALAPGDSWFQRTLVALEPIATRRSGAVVLGFALVGAVSLYGVSRVRVDTNMIEIIRPGLPIRVAHEVVDRVMGGAQSMEIYLDFAASDALKDPSVLNAMDHLQNWLEHEHPDFVVRTESLVEVVKDTFRSLNEDRAEMYRIPQEPRTLAQTLLLFDLADPEDREQLVSDDYAEGRINVRMYNYGSLVYVDFFERVQEKVAETFAPFESRYPDLDVGITGELPLMMQMSDYVSWAQLQSFALVLVVVTLLLLLVFGSVRAGLVAMIPNVYPVIVTFGAMGLVDMPLDADTLILAPLIIGIAVDDTIHFITHYRAFVIGSGDRRAAIVSTIREVGQAITFTSVILVLGFLVLIASTHQGMANFGILIAVAMSSALLADLFLLPALLVLFKIDFRSA